MWRISESALVLLAFLLGGAGAMFGMILFNHKTSKPKFRFLVPLAIIVNLIIIWYLRHRMGIDIAGIVS